MANEFQIKRSISGVASPAVAGAKEGEIAMSYGGAGAALTPQFWSFDGTAWRRINPPGVNPNIRGLTAVGAAATVQAAFNSLAPVIAAGDVVIFTYSGSAYIYTGPTGTITTATAGQFTSLGSATAFATAAEIHAGADATKALNAITLRGEAIMVPTGAGGAAAAADQDKLLRLDAAGMIDAGFLPPSTAFASDAQADAGAPDTVALNPANLLHVLTRMFGFADLAGVKTKATSAGAADAGIIPLLNAAGQFDASMLPAVPSEVKGAADVTAAMVAPVPAYKSGDIVFSNAAGTVDASWTGATGSVKSGDALIFDGTNWHVMPNETDLNAYVPLAGGTMGATAALTFPAGVAGHTIIDGNQGTLKNIVLDCGTY